MPAASSTSFTKLSSLRNDRLETERRLDVGDVLLLRPLTLLLSGHLACKRLLLSRVPLASGSKDVLERLLSLTIRNVTCRLAGLKQT